MMKLAVHNTDSPISSIEDIIEDARNGRPYILVDAEDREHEGDIVMRARDYLHADDFADRAGGLRTGVGRGLDGGDIADHDGGAEGVADLLHGAGEADVGGLEHGVDAGDKGGETPSFKETDGFGGHNVFGLGPAFAPRSTGGARLG